MTSSCATIDASSGPLPCSLVPVPEARKVPIARSSPTGIRECSRRAAILATLGSIHEATCKFREMPIIDGTNLNHSGGIYLTEQILSKSKETYEYYRDQSTNVNSIHLQIMYMTNHWSIISFYRCHILSFICFQLIVNIFGEFHKTCSISPINYWLLVFLIQKKL